jgi:DNA-binding transcriptional ArsR family regulator
MLKSRRGNSVPQSETKKQSRIRPKRLKAMEHPLRADCLRLLSDREKMSPVEVSRELGAELSHVSYHMRRLEELDCAEVVETRQVRGAVEHFYRATERHLLTLEEWVELEPLGANVLIREFLQWMLDDVGAAHRADLLGSENFHITRTPLVVDRQGFEEIMESAESHRLFASQVEKKSAERRAKSGEPGIPVNSSLMFFQTPRRSAK